MFALIKQLNMQVMRLCQSALESETLIIFLFLFLFFFFFLFCQFAGTVAAFTAGIVLLSDQQPTTKSVNELALGRIEANFYGIVIIIAMGFVWPLRSANALKRKSIPSIAKKIR